MVGRKKKSGLAAGQSKEVYSSGWKRGWWKQVGLAGPGGEAHSSDHGKARRGRIEGGVGRLLEY